MLGNTGNHSSNSLWTLSVMPHNLDTSHPVYSLKTRYSGQTLPLTLPSKSLKEFLDPRGQTMSISQLRMLQSGTEALFIPVNQKHFFGYTPLTLKNQLPCTTCTNTGTARPPELHTELPTPLCLMVNEFELPVILEIQSLCCCLWCTKQEKPSFVFRAVSAHGAGNQKTERAWCSFWFTTSWPGKSAMKSEIKNNKVRFLLSTSRWTLVHILLRKIFLCICCFLLISECNRKLEKLVSAGKRRV